MAAAERGSAVLELPRTPRLVCVEYPGLVRDVGAMLRTLGGEQGVSRVSGAPRLRGSGEGGGSLWDPPAGEWGKVPRRLHAWFRGRCCAGARGWEVSGRMGAAAHPPDVLLVERGS